MRRQGNRHMALTPEHEAARGANRKVIIVLLAVVLALYLGSFFILGS